MHHHCRHPYRPSLAYLLNVLLLLMSAKALLILVQRYVQLISAELSGICKQEWIALQFLCLFIFFLCQTTTWLVAFMLKRIAHSAGGSFHMRTVSFSLSLTHTREKNQSSLLLPHSIVTDILDNICTCGGISIHKHLVHIITLHIFSLWSFRCTLIHISFISFTSLLAVFYWIFQFRNPLL